MSHRRPQQPAETFTRPFLMTLGTLLFFAFWTISALAGIVWVAVSAIAVDRAIAMLPRR